jgi:hypothetical protein
VNNNEICGIREKSIDNLSRLRVLSLRNNKVTMMQERAFRGLKSNMMHLDVAGILLKSLKITQMYSQSALYRQEILFPARAD